MMDGGASKTAYFPPVLAGTCGWSHDDWAGVFYPKGLPPAKWLAHYAAEFGAVEVDSTFYHVPGAEQVRHWREQVPGDFRFCPRTPREITHENRLHDCGRLMTDFLKAVSGLGECLGPVLVQLPPGFTLPAHDRDLRDFLRGLPRDFQYAFEFRQPDLRRGGLVDLLGEHGAAWVWSDRHPPETQKIAPFEFLPQSTSFLYVRLLGDAEADYALPPGERPRYRIPTVDRDPALGLWRTKLHLHTMGTTMAYVFSGNHFEGHAPATARKMDAISRRKHPVHQMELL